MSSELEVGIEEIENPNAVAQADYTSAGFCPTKVPTLEGIKPIKLTNRVDDLEQARKNRREELQDLFR